MDIILKNKILSIVISILVFLNLISIGSIWYLNMNQIESTERRIPNPERKQEKKEPKDQNKDDSNIIDFLVKELKFSEQQKKKLEDEYQNYKNENKKMKDEIRDFHNEINDKVSSEINENEINTQFEKIGKKKGDLDKLTYYFFKEIRNICNSEQKRVFDDMIREIYRAINRGPDNMKR